MTAGPEVRNAVIRLVRGHRVVISAEVAGYPAGRLSPGPRQMYVVSPLQLSPIHSQLVSPRVTMPGMFTIGEGARNADYELLLAADNSSVVVQNRQFCSSDARGVRLHPRIGHTALLYEITRDEAGSPWIR